MLLFILGMAAGIAICAVIESLYARFSPWEKENRVDNWEEKRGKYGVSYKNF